MKSSQEPVQSALNWPAALSFLFTLWTLTVSQSIYSMLAANPNFLDVRLSSNGQLVLLVAVFNCLPPLALFLLWLPLHRCSATAGQALLVLVCIALLLLFFWQTHNALLAQRWGAWQNAYLLWLVPAGLLGWVAFRFPQAARTFALLLLPIVFVLPALFLLRGWSTQVTFQEQADSHLRQTVARAAASDRPSVFFLIFDELSLPVLLGPNGQIDARNYPHFHELANASTWFRQATANADFTNNSLPTMLAGVFPTRPGLDQQSYPHNLFSLLEPYYELFVYETWSKFCQPARYHCLRDSDRLEASDAALLLDVFYLFAARTVPRGVNLQLPDVRKNWGFFGNPRVGVDLALRRFDKFLDTVAALKRPSGAFVFFHNSLPHSPYWVSPQGEVQEGEPSAFDPSQRGDAKAVRAVLARYQDQVRFVDAELGETLDLLKKQGLYDASLFIVTADHGVSFDPRAPGRDLVVEDGEAVNAEPLLRVPLFVKRPGQKEGGVSNREVQLIDIMPTVADVVGVQIPWPHQGRSVFAPEASSRPRVVYDRERRRYEFSPDSRLKWQVLNPDSRRSLGAERPR